MSIASKARKARLIRQRRRSRKWRAVRDPSFSIRCDAPEAISGLVFAGMGFPETVAMVLHHLEEKLEKEKTR